MKRRYRITAVCLVAVAIVAACLWRYHMSDWPFVRRVVGFDFPERTEYLAQYDNGEWLLVSVVRLPEGSIAGFARQHGFTTLKRREIGQHSFAAHKRRATMYSEALPEPYRQIPDRVDLLSADGRTDYQSWEAILDPRSRLLWIQIIYPDWGGTHSGTAPQPSHPSPP